MLGVGMARSHSEVADRPESPGLDDTKLAWAGTLEGRSEEEKDRLALATAIVVRGIAEHGATSPESLGAQLGLEPAQARAILAGLATMGMEIDAEGNVVGAALTSTQTPHAVRLGARVLFAWCALDTLFIPGLVGEPADVESTCPVSGEAISLRVSPDGACDYTPSGAVLSVLLPGASGLQVGPASPT